MPASTSTTTTAPAPATPTLQSILQGIEVLGLDGDARIPITDIAIDSRRVRPGTAFFALPSARPDAPGGAFHIPEAIERGASAILSTDAPDIRRPGLAWVQLGDIRRALPAIALNFHAHPERQLRLAAATGTNGKTTVTTLLHHLLQSADAKWGLIGTVRYEVGGRTIPASRTTPEAHELASMMSRMRTAGCEGLVMELSSHAIAQHRADGLPFAAIAFTNLSHDHMDYHGDMEHYFQTKALPFLGQCAAPPPPFAVLNSDTAATRRLATLLPAATRPLFFGEAPDAHYRATDIHLSPDGTTFTLTWPASLDATDAPADTDAPATAPAPTNASAPATAVAMTSTRSATARTPLPGSYNVSNTLCALALAHTLGRDIATLLPALAAFPGVPGRMERVGDGWPCAIFVDYAHTDDALQNALQMLRTITPRRLLVVFGCGGNRDRAKRPKMTAVVQQLADHAWATADNPRKEPLKTIFDDMRAGVTAPEKNTFIEDRRHAISLALDAANPGDTLLIAGKGHEDYQEFANATVPFDDRAITRELLDIKRLRRPPPAGA